MVDFRLYRLSFLPALAAVIVIMFSLQGTPSGLDPAVPPAAFEGEQATAIARQIAARAPEREPGSDGDALAADLVAQRFDEIPGAIVGNQEVEATWDGDEIVLRNVVLTIPGESAGTIAIVAARASPEGPGGASSAAATGVLVELASVLAASGHDRTFLFASTGDVPAGARGVADALTLAPATDPVEAVVVISQPGAATPSQPYVVSTSAGSRSTSAQLVETAAAAVATQVGQETERPATGRQFAGLAMPAGLGPQATLIAAGTAAVAISAAGERPLPPSADEADDLSGETVDAFGRAVHAAVAALDADPARLEASPGAYVEIGDNIVPGWTLGLLGLSLILPAAVAAIDAAARALRRHAGLLRGLGWATTRALPAVGALAALYALALVGAVPRPEFPFDPGLYPFGARAAISLGVIALSAVASAYLLHRSPLAGYDRAPATALPGVGIIAVAGATLAWISNPYLGLLVAPLAHLWLLAVRFRPGWGAPIIAGVASIIALVPIAAATASVATALDLGGDLPWIAAVMTAGGHIGVLTAVTSAFLAAAIIAVVRLAAAGTAPAAIPDDRWGAAPRARTGSMPTGSNER